MQGIRSEHTMEDCGKNSQQPLRRRVSSGFCLVSRDPLRVPSCPGLFMLPARRPHLEIVLSWCAARFLITHIGIVVWQCVRMHVYVSVFFPLIFLVHAWKLFSFCLMHSSSSNSKRLLAVTGNYAAGLWICVCGKGRGSSSIRCKKPP